MFALRRVATRAVFAQPARQLSTIRPVSRPSPFQLEKPSLCGSFHQSLRWRADEEQKKPAAEELENIKEGSITATSNAADSAKESGENAAETVQETAQETAEEAKSTASNVAEKVQDAASSAAQTVQSMASGAAAKVRSNFPGNNTDGEPGKILYVGNLFFEVTTPMLEAEFGRFGEITNSRIVSDSRGLSKGFGYIEFANADSANRAVQELDQKVFQGRRMAVQHHIRREPRSQRTEYKRNPPSKTLFIGNMSYQMSDKDLNDLFREIRNVLDVRVAIDRRSGQPRGFAHADFIDVASAEKAKELLETKVVYGRQLRVDFSTASNQSQTAPRE